MGIFHDTVEFVNRTSKPLTVIYDGQRTTIEPNYDAEGNRIKGVVNMLPKIVVPYALNQNVLMGSEDSVDPSDFQSLIGIVEPKEKQRKSWHDCSYLEQSEELTRTPLKDVLDDPKAKIEVRGKLIPRAIDAAVPATAPFDVK